MKNLNQQLLNFGYTQNFKDEDYYVSSCNYYAFEFINSSNDFLFTVAFQMVLLAAGVIFTYSEPTKLSPVLACQWMHINIGMDWMISGSRFHMIKVVAASNWLLPFVITGKN